MAPVKPEPQVRIVVSRKPMQRIDEESGLINPLGVLFNILSIYGFAAIFQALPYIIGPYERGFFCDDESIQYKYKPNTISAATLICLSIGFNVVTTITAEYLVQYRIEKQIPQKQYRWRNRTFHSLFVHFLMQFGFSQLGFVCVVGLMNVTKFCIGRLRPHFLDVCRPANMEMLCPMNEPRKYIGATDYTCTGDSVQVREGRLSFFSGHSAISMYCAVYAIIYLQARIGRWSPARIPMVLAQTILLMSGLVVCYTRITDNWHHWSDVLVGLTVGTLVAIWTALFWSHLFDKSSTCIDNKPLLPVYNDDIMGNEGTVEGDWSEVPSSNPTSTPNAAYGTQANEHF